mmetsp:Transcript_18834/g.51604  ORF Transcript_18834/g.51604 Transcript_18834/m.51604 type:complete len:228 (-) Transcript_18834:2886-3569(-)
MIVIVALVFAGRVASVEVKAIVPVTEGGVQIFKHVTAVQRHGRVIEGKGLSVLPSVLEEQVEIVVLGKRILSERTCCRGCGGSAGSGCVIIVIIVLSVLIAVVLVLVIGPIEHIGRRREYPGRFKGPGRTVPTIAVNKTKVETRMPPFGRRQTVRGGKGVGVEQVPPLGQIPCPTRIGNESLKVPRYVAKQFADAQRFIFGQSRCRQIAVRHHRGMFGFVVRGIVRR